MKTFANKNPQTLEQAVSFVQQARKDGQTPSVVGGGSESSGDGERISYQDGCAC